MLGARPAGNRRPTLTRPRNCVRGGRFRPSDKVNIGRDRGRAAKARPTCPSSPARNIVATGRRRTTSMSTAALIDKTGAIKPDRQALKDAYDQDRAVRRLPQRCFERAERTSTRSLIATARPITHDAVGRARHAMERGYHVFGPEAADLHHRGEPQAGVAGRRQPRKLVTPDGQPRAIPATMGRPRSSS